MKQSVKNIFFEGDVLWSQIDANQHLRHSAYADFAAQARLCMLEQAGITTRSLLDLKIGPILFREDISYLRETGLGDRVRVSCELMRARPDGSRWSIRHELYRSDDVKTAVIIAEGAWIDMQQRKLALLPEHISASFMNAPKSGDFTWEPVK